MRTLLDARHRTRGLRARRRAAAGAAAMALLLAGCGGDAADDAAAEAAGDAAGQDEAEQDDGAADEAAGDAEEENPLLDLQQDIEVPATITDLVTLPDDFEPDSLITEMEDPNAGTLEDQVGGELPGGPDELVALVDAMVADAGMDEVETEEVTAEGNPRTRHRWRGVSGDTELDVDLVVSSEEDGGDLTVKVRRPM